MAIVTSFKYLGLHDTEDGAIENAVRARVIRMEYLFKQFQGRVLTNHKIDVLPRMNVFKTIVMTNRLYACETWNYTTTDTARLERHYFRLLRDTLLLPKNDADFAFAKVLDMAEEHSVPFGVFDTTEAAKVSVENYPSRRYCSTEIDFIRQSCK